MPHYQRVILGHETGSNRKKARVRVARAHAKAADSRRDFHHKTPTAIIRDNQAVHAEDLCVTGLARTRMAKSVHDAGWSAFVTMLEYKAKRYSRYFGKVGRLVPSTQLWRWLLSAEQEPSEVPHERHGRNPRAFQAGEDVNCAVI